jgi:hypothetical protein
MGMIDIIITRVGNHVFLGVAQKRGERKCIRRGMWEVRDAAGGLDQVLLLLTVNATHEAAVMSFLTSAFFVRWV